MKDAEIQEDESRAGVKLLVVAVTAAHLLVCLLFVTQRAGVQPPKEPTQLVVNTVKLKPPPKPQPQPVTKLQPKTAVVKKAKPAAKPTPVKPDRKLAKLVQEAQNRLAKVDEKVTSKETPKQMSLAIDQSSYDEELAERLRLLLKLPEWGSVRVALTLRRDGTVCGVEVLSAQNETNRNYVLRHLEKQTLAPFGDHYKGEPTHTFTLTLNNEL